MNRNYLNLFENLINNKKEIINDRKSLQSTRFKNHTNF